MILLFRGGKQPGEKRFLSKKKMLTKNAGCDKIYRG